MIETAIPMFKNEYLDFIREEKEGYYTIIPKFHPETRELVINKTSKEILELCDGENTVENIISIMKKKYPLVPQETIKRDIHKTLAFFSRLLILSWDSENPFLFNREEIIDDEYSMRIGSENDIREILSFLERFKIDSKKELDKDVIFYKSVFCGQFDYEEIPLRQKLFSFAEDFFLLMKDKSIEGLISIQVPTKPIQAAIIRLIYCPFEKAEFLLKYSTDNLQFIAVNPIAKIKIHENLNNEFDSRIKNFIVKSNFVEEGISISELGVGIDIRTWSWYYPQEYIKEVEKRREELAYS